MSLLFSTIDGLLQESSDPRTKTWWFLDKSIYPASIVTIYLSLVYIILPKYMENRKPYSLKKIIRVYNLCQMIVCSALTTMFFFSGYSNGNIKVIGWYPPISNDEVESMRMAKLMYINFIVRAIDLVDTIFFCLRKKTNQITPLHVFHHAFTFMMGWTTAKCLPGGSVSFTPLINFFVHTIMYTYYFLSSLETYKPAWLSKIKKYLTTIQMSQLSIITLHLLHLNLYDKGKYTSLVNMSVPIIGTMLYGFYDFYINEYLKKKTT